MKELFKRGISLLLALALLLPVPSQAAQNFHHTEIPTEKEKYLNDHLEDIRPKDFSDDPTTQADPTTLAEANDQIADPAYPKTYTVEANFKVQRGERQEVNYQPYRATVGDEKCLTDEEKEKINQIVDLPGLDGYTQPTPRLSIDYNFVKDKANRGGGRLLQGSHFSKCKIWRA